MSRGLSGRLAARAMLVTTAAALASACSSNPPARTVGGVSRSVFSEDDYGVSSSPRVTASRYVPKGGGTYKLGAPYKVAGRWYVPHENPNYVENGVASWYGDDFHGRKTANGEVFDATSLTAAHPTLPLPSYALVTNLDNGKSVLVRVNDRGPYVNDRIIDLSQASAKELGYLNHGRARVRVQYAGRAPLNGNDSRERQYLADQQSRRGNAFPPGALASNRDESPSAYRDGRQAYRDAAPAYGDAPMLSAEPQQWSPMGYRTSLTSKASQPAPRRYAEKPIETASFDQQRMSLTAPPAAIRPFAPARTYVQVGLFRDRSNAERLRRELGSLGPIEVAPVQAADGMQVYRVRMGPFSPDAASRTQNQIASYGVAGSAIVTD
ncbi:MAG: septal ring lytic transglycosylase RlpA family protein [Hyphomicrobium sp.]|uniref:septal ring lytic transglycosylase RlpA family protein n=1 Tax=Hyphomicrobium sp. TaxID=82 RepID=UPI0035672F27